MTKLFPLLIGPIALAGLLSACDQSQDRQSISDSVRANESPGRIAARVGERAIALSEVDEAIKLPLYDLERAQYDLRAQQLAKLLAAAKAGAEPEIFLTPPPPPRLDLEKSTAPRKGSADAPVVISVFCSVQSPHCARMQPIFSQIGQDYGERIAWQHFDLPQSFHREGRPAALAARCAGTQDAYWTYLQALYAFYQDLNPERYRAIARQLLPDPEQFDACLEQQRFRPQIEADVAYAEKLGLGNVPVVFVNGLYIKGPQPYREYQRWIDWELQRLGLRTGADKQPREVSLQRTKLPLRLVATTLSNDPDASTALIQVEAAEPKPFRIWQRLLPNVALVAVEGHQVLLDNKGQLEFLPLQGDSKSNSLLNPAGTEAAGSSAHAQTASAGASTGDPERRVIPPSGQIPLKRAWVEAQLEDRSELERRFNEAEHVVEGHHLLKLEGVMESEFYTALGLEEGDVLLRVNDQWLHTGQNPLWQALQDKTEVSVVLIRNGLPVHYQYSIE